MAKAIEPEFVIREAADGSYALEGELSFASTGEALRATPRLKCGDGSSVTFDLTGVTRSDSAGLALLLEWQRMALAEGGRLRYTNFPDQLLALARVAGVDDIFSAYAG